MLFPKSFPQANSYFCHYASHAEVIKASVPYTKTGNRRPVHVKPDTQQGNAWLWDTSALNGNSPHLQRRWKRTTLCGSFWFERTRVRRRRDSTAAALSWSHAPKFTNKPTYLPRMSDMFPRGAASVSKLARNLTQKATTTSLWPSKCSLQNLDAF